MSYCRAGNESDVYVIATTDKVASWWCVSCSVPNNFVTSRQEMLSHLQEHKLAGDRVPDYAIARLQREIEEENKNEGDNL